MARRATPAAEVPRGGPDPRSYILPGRQLVTVEVSAGEDLHLPPVPRGSVVRLRVRVEPGSGGDWEETSAWREALSARLSAAAFVYPPEVDARAAAEPGERRVLSARDPEAALREYVAGLGIPEGDAALVEAEGLDVLHASGIS